MFLIIQRKVAFPPRYYLTFIDLPTGYTYQENKESLRVRNGIHFISSPAPCHLQIQKEINALLKENFCKGARTTTPQFISKLVQDYNKWTSTVTSRSSAAALQDPATVVRVYESIVEQSWQRIVSLHVSTLKKSAPWAPDTYGEVLPSLVSLVIGDLASSLSKSSLIVDLGSGVGNVVAQVAMMAGCRSLGVEIRPDRHSLALALLSEIDSRLDAWKLPRVSDRVELLCMDMLRDEVRSRLPLADVVFVNNYILGSQREYS